MKDLEKKRALCLNRTTPFTAEEVEVWREWGDTEPAEMIAGWQTLTEGPNAGLRVREIMEAIKVQIVKYMNPTDISNRREHLATAFALLDEYRAILKGVPKLEREDRNTHRLVSWQQVKSNLQT